MMRTSGRLHVVDHIIPQEGRKVSDLHIESNLRVIEHHENAVTHNYWESPGCRRPGGEDASNILARLSPAALDRPVGLWC